MNWNAVFASELVADLGWTLFHSVWQFALTALCLAVALRLMRNARAGSRYALAVFMLAISVALPVVTFVQYYRATRAETRSPIAASTEKAAAGIATRPQPEPFDETAPASSTVSAGNEFSLSSLMNTIERRLPSLFPVAVFGWIIGIAIFSLRITGGLWQLNRIRTVGVSQPDEDWASRFQEICSRLDLGDGIRFICSDLVETPIAMGVVRPMIIVPASAFLHLSPQQLETIIAHELIHIRRFDPLVNAVQAAIETIFFYHPAIWWMSSRIRAEREFAADAGVLELFDSSHTLYASALADLEEIRLTANMTTPRFAAAANGGNLMQRIQKILQIKTEVSRASSAWTAGLALLLTSAVLLMALSFSSGGHVNAHSNKGSKTLAIGFVSIPPVDRTTNAPKDSDATMRLLIDALKRHKVPATGFLHGGMVSDGEKFFPVRKEIARMWIDAGFEVGLGGFKHLKLYDTPVNEYITNIEKNETIAKQLIGDMGLPPRYFSYPYLNTGKTAADRETVEKWLSTRGYTPVKYTVDSQEWMYSYAYDMARNDNDVNTMKEVRSAYLAYISKMFDLYESYSQEMFGRDIAQTMVLTSSRLVTDTADDFFAMLDKRGYSYVSIDKAQSDEAYKTKDDFIGDAGISWFERWAIVKKMQLKDAPRVDADIAKTWETRSKK